MNIIIGILAVLLLIFLMSIDLIVVPYALKIVLGWFGIMLSFWQCLIIVILFHVITYGLRKK